MRQTIARRAELGGVGLHTGAPVRVGLLPAETGAGITFARVDLPGRPVTAAHLDDVSATARRTVLGRGPSAIATVEHLLASVVAAGIDDLRVEVDGAELPIGDGSFMPFVALLEEAGKATHGGSRQVLVVDRSFEVGEGASRYRIEPADALRLEVTLEYAEPVIGRQSASLTVTPAGFAEECAPARTFGFDHELTALRAAGLAAGATLENAILCSATAVLHTTLRWPNEFARHKLGDLLGDLALLGAVPRVRIVAERPSHAGNLTCMRALARAGHLVEVE